MKPCTREQMAYVYAGLLAVKDYPFERLNALIMNTWSMSGLVYVKEKAWKIAKELHKWETS